MVKAPESVSSGEDEAEDEGDLDAIAEGGMPGEAAEELAEADLATPLAHGQILEAFPANDTTSHGAREDLTASEMAARASILPADLQPAPG